MSYKITFEGLVQGVGFRPFLYRQAQKMRLKGYVKNTGSGVELLLDRHVALERLLQGRPPMSRIDRAIIEKNPTSRKYQNFSIKASPPKTGQSEIPPDIFLCPDCLKEMRDPANRRFGYFFITCTNCGPRYTAIGATPYDREKTSLKKFKLCPDCAREYRNPLNRRYHAETIACPKCGPKLKLWRQGQVVRAANPISATANLIKQGRIVAVKGIGGFHLVCQTQTATVKKLRRITGRPRKPFALMVKNILTAKKLARLNQQEIETLSGPPRPIVVVAKRHRNAFKEVSALDSLGLMLPYTGLHYLLFDYLDEPLVFTSANRPDQPLSTRRQEQIVPDVLDHNRPILNPADDSIIKVIDGQPFFSARRAATCRNRLRPTPALRHLGWRWGPSKTALLPSKPAEKFYYHLIWGKPGSQPLSTNFRKPGATGCVFIKFRPGNYAVTDTRTTPPPNTQSSWPKNGKYRYDRSRII